MRAVVQVVSEARVSVGGTVVGRIDQPGLVVLLGVTHDDTAAIAEQLAAKIHELRIMDDERSAAELGAPLLVVSQFTLYGATTKGRRPTWAAAAPGPMAEPLVEAFCQALRQRGATVEEGIFGADMQVALVNDGPRTLILETPRVEPH